MTTTDKSDVKNFPGQFVRIVAGYQKLFENSKQWAERSSIDNTPEYVDGCINYLCALVDYDVISSSAKTFYEEAGRLRRRYQNEDIDLEYLRRCVHREWDEMWQKIGDAGHTLEILQRLGSSEFQKVKSLSFYGSEKPFTPASSTQKYYETVAQCFPNHLNQHIFYQSFGWDNHMNIWWDHMFEILEHTKAGERTHLVEYLIVASYWNRHGQHLREQASGVVSEMVKATHRGHRLRGDVQKHLENLLKPIYRTMGSYQATMARLQELEESWYVSAHEPRLLKSILFMRQDVIKESGSSIDHWYVREELLRTLVHEGIYSATERLRQYIARFPGMVPRWFRPMVQVSDHDIERAQELREEELRNVAQTEILQKGEKVRQFYESNSIDAGPGKRGLLFGAYGKVPISDSFRKILPNVVDLIDDDGTAWRVEIAENAATTKRPWIRKIVYRKDGKYIHTSSLSIYGVAKYLVSGKWERGFGTPLIVHSPISTEKKDILRKYVIDIEKSAIDLKATSVSSAKLKRK